MDQPDLTREAFIESTAAGIMSLTLPSAPGMQGTARTRLRVNGASRTIDGLDPRTTLLDVLREYLGLTGTKKGCDHGQCGACTVHLNGRAVLSCLTLAISAEGAAIRTIEGLGTATDLHPMQVAFIRRDALQCGYCTPGQIMSAVALLQSQARPDAESIAAHMSGNICRCGAYQNIASAVADVAAQRSE